MLSSLKAPKASTEDLIEYLEDTCWEVCKPHYSLEASTLQEEKVFQVCSSIYLSINILNMETNCYDHNFCGVSVVL